MKKEVPIIINDKVDLCVTYKEIIADLQEKLTNVEKIVIDSAKKEVKKLEEDFVYTGTIDVKGTEKTIQVQFKDQYSEPKIPLIKLKEVFGAIFNTFFQQKLKYEIIESSIDNLKIITGERFKTFIKTKKSILPVKDFNKVCNAASFDKEQEEVIDRINKEYKHKPTLKYS